MKRLIFRLSSLGDIILAQSALEPKFSGETHWVVAREFETLLADHPKIHRVWTFDRRHDGRLAAWLRLLRELHAENFDEVLDLHSTLRTRIARFYFAWLSFANWMGRKERASRTPPPASSSSSSSFVSFIRWKTISKGRVRRLGYLLFKRLWPRHFRPLHLAMVSARLGGGTGTERADLRWLAEKAQKPLFHHEDEVLVAIAPSSAWWEKEWPAEKYVTLVERLRAENANVRILLFGTSGDESALHLRELLQMRKLSFEDYVGALSLSEVAKALQQCDLIIGPDTGLIHLSEAVGTPAVVLYGPTRSDFGFGPSHPDSRGVHGPVLCSPCSKDGTLCYRFGDRYACLRKMKVDSVLGVTLSLVESVRESRSSGAPGTAGAPK